MLVTIGVATWHAAFHEQLRRIGVPIYTLRVATWLAAPIWAEGQDATYAGYLDCDGQ